MEISVTRLAILLSRSGTYHGVYQGAAAQGLGLFVLFVGEFYDDNIRQYLCLDKTDEHPLLFLAIDTKQPVVDTHQKKFIKIQ